jgi:hypothetical protein
MSRPLGKSREAPTTAPKTRRFIRRLFERSRRARLFVVAALCLPALSIVAGPVSASNGTWSAVSAPPPAGLADPSAIVSSVSCASAGYCSAVGNYKDAAGDQQGLLFNEIAGVWGPGTQLVLPQNAAASAHVTLGSVSCAKAGYCSAIGSYSDGSYFGQALVVNEANGVWERPRRWQCRSRVTQRSAVGS